MLWFCLWLDLRLAVDFIHQKEYCGVNVKEDGEVA